MKIIICGINDLKKLTDIAIKLFDDNEYDDLYSENNELLCDNRNVFFAATENGEFIAFAHCSLRSDYVEGTDSSPVGYLEGIYVEPDFRHKGVASELLKTCIAWAKEKDCREFASDCLLENTDSLKFHLKLGFEEANRLICFKMDI